MRGGHHVPPMGGGVREVGGGGGEERYSCEGLTLPATGGCWWPGAWTPVPRGDTWQHGRGEAEQPQQQKQPSSGGRPTKALSGSRHDGGRTSGEQRHDRVCHIEGVDDREGEGRWWWAERQTTERETVIHCYVSPALVCRLRCSRGGSPVTCTHGERGQRLPTPHHLSKGIVAAVWAAAQRGPATAGDVVAGGGRSAVPAAG